ncbi:MAG: AAA family ATPase [Acutalibacteraceae bacterium]|jgi:MoxR-like ATPase
MIENGRLNSIKENIKKVVVGKDEIIDMMLVALICSGHVIIEDLPGLGKTTLASALADSLGCSFQRIQFTPDVLPSDITGFNMFDMQTGKQIFQKGSVYNQIILADEINRASPKTQSALLEAMQEQQVTVDGKTYQLPKPFMIMATQNPVDMAGTYPLPEAQMDRFLMKINMGYPAFDAEKDIVRSHRSVTERVKLQPVASAEDIIKIQESVSQVYIDDDVLNYIVELTTATRSFEGVLVGVSPRGTIALAHAVSGLAILNGRNYVLPDDVKRMAPYVLCHRMIMKNRSGAAGTTAYEVIVKILGSLKVPKVKG